MARNSREAKFLKVGLLKNLGQTGARHGVLVLSWFFFYI